MKKPRSTDWPFLETLWRYLHVEDELPTHADVAVIGGSGKQIDGADRAVTLYHDGIVKRIIVSGFNNPYLTSGDSSEAVLLRDRLVALGVPESAVILDETAKNTGDNVLHTAEILAPEAIYDVILIHKPYMTRRFLATAQAQWPTPQPHFYVTSQPTSAREYYDAYEQSDDENKMIEMMLGDYERLKTYPAQGLTTEQPHSQQAEGAYQELLARGFAGKEMTS